MPDLAAARYTPRDTHTFRLGVYPDGLDNEAVWRPFDTHPCVLDVTGRPSSGKSTLAATLVAQALAQGIQVTVIAENGVAYPTPAAMSPSALRSSTWTVEADQGRSLLVIDETWAPCDRRTPGTELILGGLGRQARTLRLAVVHLTQSVTVDWSPLPVVNVEMGVRSHGYWDAGHGVISCGHSPKVSFDVDRPWLPHRKHG